MTTTTEYKAMLHDLARELCTEIDWCLYGVNYILSELDVPQLAEDKEWIGGKPVDLPLDRYRAFVRCRLLQMTREDELCVSGFNTIMEKLDMPGTIRES